MNATNHGTTDLTFSHLFADTVCTHGEEWARSYYSRNGMQGWEFDFWMRATGCGVAA